MLEENEPNKGISKDAKWIIGAILGSAAVLWFALAPEKDLSHLHPYERCEYRQYYKKVGGTMAQCQAIEGDKASRRLRGY